ncbi:glycosyltransferase family 2 protein [Atlantibacter hermannii]|uniref:glycosyltransferase family 2 protein n=1 Tax=Atlantibacter hermannii TaxID=565 RepID=UPI00289F7623|nr:glycosyltransferase family 2 protein [Atlantibacter hermannii]
MAEIKYSTVIPVYKNEESISRLITELNKISHKLGEGYEVVFVVDGSPDRSFEMLSEQLKTANFSSQLVLHSRNFGSFAAIRTGLIHAKGQYFGVMAADLQEPPALMLDFFKALEHEDADVVIGTRDSRADPLSSRLASTIFWGLYKRLVVHDMPDGGVDVFGCNINFRDELIKLNESRSSLVALIFWLGFKRKFISYSRLQRIEGKSSWTFRKKFDYMMDSIFAFTDYPIRLLTKIGLLGSIFSLFLGIIIFFANLLGFINVPGYTAIMLVVLFLGMLNLLGLGLVGTYAWRGYENTKQRPLSIVSFSTIYAGKQND